MTNIRHLFAALIERGQFELGVSSVMMQDISRRINNINVKVSSKIFQVPQLHPNQVLDIPEVFKSILQIGEQM